MDYVLLAQEHGWWGGGVVIFVLALILVLVLVKFWLFRGWWGYRGPGRSGDWPDTSPEAVLKRRLAGGEISEVDYERLLGLIKR